jgi:hypothetical protein
VSQLDSPQKPVSVRLGVLARFRRHDPFPDIADALAARDYAQIDNPELLLDTVARQGTRSFRKRLIAVEALRHVDLDPKQALRAEAALVAILLRRDVHPLNRFLEKCGNAAWRFGRLFIATRIVAFVIYQLQDNIRAPDGAPPVWMGPLFGIGGMAWGLLGVATLATPFVSPLIDGHRESRLRDQALATLGQLGGPGSIHALALAATMKLKIGMGAKAMPSLRAVLQSLTPADYGCVPPEAIRRLCDLVVRCNSQGLTYLAADMPLMLDALGKTAGGNAIPAVETIAASGHSPAWREQAAHILPVLNQRHRLEQDSARLLHPTKSPDSTESLLRPSFGETMQPADLLLHPTSTDP